MRARDPRTRPRHSAIGVQDRGQVQLAGAPRVGGGRGPHCDHALSATPASKWWPGELTHHPQVRGGLGTRPGGKPRSRAPKPWSIEPEAARAKRTIRAAVRGPDGGAYQLHRPGWLRPGPLLRERVADRQPHRCDLAAGSSGRCELRRPQVRSWGSDGPPGLVAREAARETGPWLRSLDRAEIPERIDDEIGTASDVVDRNRSSFAEGRHR